MKRQDIGSPKSGAAGPGRALRFRRGLALLLVLAGPLAFAGCRGTFRQIGLSRKPDIDQRTGPVGTQEKPTTISPFEDINWVLAGDECRWIQIRVPHEWYWLLTVTVVNEDPGREARLEAALDASDGTWKNVPPTEFHKTFNLSEGSNQATVGDANTLGDRYLEVRLCQDGAPARVRLSSEVSPFGSKLFVPPLPKKLEPASAQP